MIQLPTEFDTMWSAVRDAPGTVKKWSARIDTIPGGVRITLRSPGHPPLVRTITTTDSRRDVAEQLGEWLGGGPDALVR